MRIGALRVAGVALTVGLIWSGTAASALASTPARAFPDDDSELVVLGEAVALTPDATAQEQDIVGKVAIGALSIDAVPQSTAGLKTITCSGRYDYPHAGSSSNRKKVNAHLIVTCSGTVAADARFTQITMQSRMMDTTDGRLGAVSTGTAIGSGRIGGDLACVAARIHIRPQALHPSCTRLATRRVPAKPGH